MHPVWGGQEHIRVGFEPDPRPPARQGGRGEGGGGGGGGGALGLRRLPIRDPQAWVKAREKRIAPCGVVATPARARGRPAWNGRRLWPGPSRRMPSNHDRVRNLARTFLRDCHAPGPRGWALRDGLVAPLTENRGGGGSPSAGAKGRSPPPTPTSSAAHHPSSAPGPRPPPNPSPTTACPSPSGALLAAGVPSSH